MSQAATWAAMNPVGPRLGKTAAVAVTTASVVKDLQTMCAGNIWSALQSGQLVMMLSVADVYIAFNSENGGTIDQAAVDATTPGQQCGVLPAGIAVPLRPPYTTQADINGSAGAITLIGMTRYMLVKGDVASTLRLWVASEKPSARSGS